MKQVNKGYTPQRGKITKEARKNIYRMAKEFNMFNNAWGVSYLIDGIKGNKTKAQTPTLLKREPSKKQIKYLNYLIFSSDDLTVDYYNKVIKNYNDKVTA